MLYGGKLTRIKSLDSLRGAAALVVVFHHLLLVKPAAWASYSQSLPLSVDNPWTWIYSTPLSLLVNGSASVLIFFVLSGLVLALTFVNRDHLNYTPFLIKRIARIWPGFAVAILISATFQWFVEKTAPFGVSAWFLSSWNVAPSPEVIAEHLELTQFITNHAGELDNPMWSLVHEIRISLIFPLIVLFVRRRLFVAMLATVTLMFASTFLIVGSHRALVTSLANTGCYVWLFVAGAAISANLQLVRARITASPRQVRALIWMVSLGLLTLAGSGDRYFYSLAIKLLGAGAGAIGTVAMCTTENGFTRFLEMPLPTWFGKVSYSVYLIHVPVILFVYHVFPQSSFLLNAAISILFTLLMAEALYRAVEAPSIRIGRKLALRFLGHESQCSLQA